MICVSIANISFEQLLIEISHFKMMELRLDLLNYTPDQYLSLIDYNIPIIATYRGKTIDKEKKKILDQLISKQVQYIDFDVDELDNDREQILESARQNKTSVVLSSHVFNRMPDRVQIERLKQYKESRFADIIKLACKAQNQSDIKTIQTWYKEINPLVAFSMGEYAQSTRLDCLSWGAPWTYAAFDEQSSTAQGQFPFKIMQTILNERK
ncbi:MAG: type I 3-dehydroquinate dehydratase [Bacteroidales bacterium]|nr:type I 3-dehydroquinate dehydratase [Bacteroidales bacterium]